MRIDVNRLTLRNVDPTLKRALLLRAQQKKQSMEKTILQILEAELEREIEITKMIDQQFVSS